MAYHLDGRDIVIDGWENGIAENPYQGISDMRNIDIITVPGEASVAMSTQTTISQGAITNVTFTVDPATDTFTYDGVIPLEVNTAVTFTNSGGALPAGLSANTAYYIKTVPSSTTFTVSAVSAGGALKDVTGAGSGTNTFSTINMSIPKHYTKYQIARFLYSYFVVDSNGRCWVYNNVQYGSTNKWVYMHNLASEASTGYGNGLQAYKGWLFNFTTGYLDAIWLEQSVTSNLAYLTTYANWRTNWKTASADSSSISSDSRQALIGQDDVMYWCAGSGVGSLDEIAGSVFAIAETHTIATGATTSGSGTITTGSAFFSSTDQGAVIVGTNIPTGTKIKSVTSSTEAELDLNTASGTASGLTFTITKSYTFNNEALALPTSDSAVCLEQLGTNLLVGGRNNFVYPWDRISSSYNYPIFLSENNVARMVTINTTTYLFTGNRGRIFMTNGSNVSLFWKIPDYLSDTVNPYFLWTDATFNRNQLYFGFKCTDNAGTTINKYGGLWAIDMDTNAGRQLNQLSYGTYSGYASALCNSSFFTQQDITPSTSDGYGLFIGWYDGSTGGIDKGISTPYATAKAYVNSDMIPVGQFLTKRTFEKLEYKLSTPLVSGETVTLGYRTNINEAFTNVPITQGGSTGDLSGITGTVNFENVQWIQIQAFLTSTASSPSYVRLREIRIT